MKVKFSICFQNMQSFPCYLNVYFIAGDAEQLLFFQLPDVLPGLPPRRDEDPRQKSSGDSRSGTDQAKKEDNKEEAVGSHITSRTMVYT